MNYCSMCFLFELWNFLLFCEVFFKNLLNLARDVLIVVLYFGGSRISGAESYRRGCLGFLVVERLH